jgi:hypothetical protein
MVFIEKLGGAVAPGGLKGDPPLKEQFIYIENKMEENSL